MDLFCTQKAKSLRLGFSLQCFTMLNKWETLILKPGVLRHAQTMPAAARRVDLSHQGSVRSTFDHITCLQTREPSNCAVELQRRTRRRPRASKCDQLVEAPARTARTVRARALISCVEVYSCRHCRARPVTCIRRCSNTSRKAGACA